MRRFFAGVLVVLILAGNVQAEDMKILVVIKGHNLPAVFEDNPASRVLYELLPITVNMKNVYNRELSFTLPGKLPVSRLSANNYSIGDIVYIPHRNSLAILYQQNGERFRRQHLGHIISGAEYLKNAGTIEVTFAPAE